MEDSFIPNLIKLLDYGFIIQFFTVEIIVGSCLYKSNLYSPWAFYFRGANLPYIFLQKFITFSLCGP